MAYSTYFGWLFGVNVSTISKYVSPIGRVWVERQRLVLSGKHRLFRDLATPRSDQTAKDLTGDQVNIEGRPHLHLRPLFCRFLGGCLYSDAVERRNSLRAFERRYHLDPPGAYIRVSNTSPSQRVCGSIGNGCE